MQRLISVMVALLSLIAANLVPAGAQRPGNANPALVTTANGTQELPADKTVPSLVVRDTKFVLAGHVTEDVLTINCQTTILPGATVGRRLTAIGGSINDQTEGRVACIQLSETLIGELNRQLAPVAPAPATTHKVGNQTGKWLGGQFMLFLVGLLTGLIALVVAPRATDRTGEVLYREPARCLVVGTLGGGLMLMFLCFAYGLMKSPFSILATPLGAGYAIFCLGTLLFGWICGLRYAGQYVAGRFGRSRAAGMIIQFFMGLSVFCLVNALTGSLSHGLGVLGMFVEFLLALAGLGAALLSGFGADPNWLTARMRGEVHWLSRTPRL